MGQLRFTPNSEMHVREWFVSRLSEMPYDLVVSQTQFPDFILVDEQGKPIRAEVEFLSHNFLVHLHPAHQCDLVICWIHDSSLDVPVLELSSGILYDRREIRDSLPEGIQSRASRKSRYEQARQVALDELKDEVRTFLACYADDLKAQRQAIDLIEAPRGRCIVAARAVLRGLSCRGYKFDNMALSDLLALLSPPTSPPTLSMGTWDDSGERQESTS